MSTVYEHATQYEDRVSQPVRAHVDEMMASWAGNGRSDIVIEDLVRSLVLNAYVEGRRGSENERLVDLLRSAHAVIKRIHDAGFNPAILDRIHEALVAHGAGGTTDKPPTVPTPTTTPPLADTGKMIPVGYVQDKDHRLNIDQAIYNMQREADDHQVHIHYGPDTVYHVWVIRTGRRDEATGTWLADALSALYRKLEP